MEVLKFLQYNMGGMRAAAADAELLMNRKGIDVALISEISKASIHGYQKFESGRAAILVRYGIEVMHLASLGETVVVQIGNLKILSTYWGPNDPIEGSLADLEAVIRVNPEGKWVIGGDLDVGLEPIVKHETLNWRKLPRSEIAQPVIDAYGFMLWNDNTPMCHHMGYQSINDYTLSQSVEIMWSPLPQWPTTNTYVIRSR